MNDWYCRYMYVDEWYGREEQIKGSVHIFLYDCVSHECLWIFYTCTRSYICMYFLYKFYTQCSDDRINMILKFEFD